jgi:hypothetical protein
MYVCVCVQVAGMPLRMLRSQLTARNLDATGSRVALEARLQGAIAAEKEQVCVCVCVCVCVHSLVST